LADNPQSNLRPISVQPQTNLSPTQKNLSPTSDQFNENGTVFIKLDLYNNNNNLTNLRRAIASIQNDNEESELSFLTMFLEHYTRPGFIFEKPSKSLDLLESTIELLKTYNQWNKTQNQSGGKRTRRNPSGNNKKTHKKIKNKN
jgi:hypothetical protein